MVKMKRIIMHWTGGAASASGRDLKAYHGLVEQSCEVVYGDYKPEDNTSTAGGHYAAHTRALNTGSIGLAMCGMHGARENPFNPGKHPLTGEQVKRFAGLVAEFAHTYQIPVTRRTILFHSEVQETLGIWQRAKWDCMWLPGMDRPGNAIEVGDTMRFMVAAKLPKERKPFWKGWFR